MRHRYNIVSEMGAVNEGMKMTQLLTERLFALSQEIAHLGVWHMVFEKGFAEWSDECLRIYGLPSDQKYHTYEEWLSFIHAEDKEMVTQELSRMDSEGSVTFDTRIIRPDNEIRYVHQVTIPLFDTSDTAPIGLFGICLDVTEHTLTRRELISTVNDLNNYKEAIDASSIVSITDPAGMIKYANNKFVEVSKYSVEELLMQSHNVINSGLHDATFWRDFWQTITAGKIWRGLLRNRAKDNTLYWVDTCVVPFTDSTGKIAQYIAVRHDVTELQNIRYELEKKNEALQAALDELKQRARIEQEKNALCDIIFKSKTEDDLMTALGASLHEKVGITFLSLKLRDLMSGESYWKVNFTANQNEEVRSNIMSELSTRYSSILENSFVQAGAPIFASTGCSDFSVPLNSIKEETIGWVIFGCVNIEKSGDLYIEMLRGLAELIAIKTAELRANNYMIRANDILQEEVNQQTKELREINKSLELFTSTVSHDLKAPLRIINAFINLLKSEIGDQLTESTQTYIGFISDSSKNMTELITALLRFSQLGKYELKKEAMDPKPVIDFICEEQKQIYPDKECEFDINTPLHVHADPILMRQVFENLLSNAVKYSSKREIIKIGVNQFQDNGFVVFQVKDNGAGFDKSLQQRLFQPFQRLHSESDFAGHGIGLANVARIIERHGGTIRGFNNQDTGCTFEFRLPAE